MSYSLISALIAGHHTAMALRSAAVQQPSLPVMIRFDEGDDMQVSLLEDIPIHRAFQDQGYDVVCVSLGGEQLDINKTLADNGVEEGAKLYIPERCLVEDVRARLIALAQISMRPSWRQYYATKHNLNMNYEYDPELMKNLPTVDLLDQAIRFDDTESATRLLDAGAPIDDNHIRALFNGLTRLAVKGILNCSMALFNGLTRRLSEDDTMKLAHACPQLQPKKAVTGKR